MKVMFVSQKNNVVNYFGVKYVSFTLENNGDKVRRLYMKFIEEG